MKWITKHEQNFGQIVFNLFDGRKKLKSIVRFNLLPFFVCVFFVSYFLVGQAYFFSWVICPGLIISLFVKVYLLRTNKFIINDRGMGCPFMWSISWSSLAGYRVDKENQTLIFESDEGKVKGVKFNNLNDLEEVIKVILEKNLLIA